MPKLEIIVREDPEDYSYTDVTFKLDGKEIGFGSYGGEPEDNTRGRDYRWVEDVITKISKALGAEVIIKQAETKED